MKLKAMKMEYWFMKTAQLKYNFSESGIPDFYLQDFLKRLKIDVSVLYDIYLGNNDTWGSLAFRKEVANIYKTVSPKDILIANGTSEALYIFFNLFLKKKSKVLVLFPAFPPLCLIPHGLGANLDYFDILNFNNKTDMFRDLILRIKKTKPHLVIINIPHNPTGFTFCKEEILEIGMASKNSKSTILFDEHYRFLPIKDSRRIMPSAYDVVYPFYKNVFAVGSIIKCCGIVGVRIGWLIGEKSFLSEARDYKDYTTHCTPIINEKIARLAITNMDRLTHGAIDTIKKNWLFLKESDLVKSNELILKYELEGGCVCFPKVARLSGIKLAKILADKFKVSVLPGIFFNKGDYIRINLAQKIQSFKYLLVCIRDIMDNYGQKIK